MLNYVYYTVLRNFVDHLYIYFKTKNIVIPMIIVRMPV